MREREPGIIEWWWKQKSEIIHNTTIRLSEELVVGCALTGRAQWREEWIVDTEEYKRSL